jgi:putative cofactor-binding repeat protein
MRVGRREVLLGGAALGFAVAAGPRIGFSHETGANGRGIVPGGGEIDQTEALQAAIDAAAASGTPLFLPAGIYWTGKLTLKSGTHIEGVPGATILRSRGGGPLIALEGVERIQLSGLVLDGNAKPFHEQDALLAAARTKDLDIANCRFTGSTAHGIALRRVSGRIEACEIGDICKNGLLGEDGSGLHIAHNAVRDCGENGIVVSRSGPGNDMIANNLVERAAGGISIANFAKGGRPAVIHGNRIRNLFFRHDAELRGVGIAVEADSVVTGNLVEGAPAYGIMIGWGPHLRDVHVTGNRLRNAWTGIGVSVDPSAGTVRIAGNSIAGTKEGAIRALSGLTPIGPDLAVAGAEPYRGVAVQANVTS